MSKPLADIFYVYEHWRPDKNVCFYVGKGKGKRAVDEETGTKISGDWFSDPQSTCRKHGSKSKGRKMASAMIAKIPLPLSRHIAATFRSKL